MLNGTHFCVSITSARVIFKVSYIRQRNAFNSWKIIPTVSLGITCLQKAGSFKTFTKSLNIQALRVLPRSAFICAPICIIYHAKSLSRDFTGAHLSVEIGARLFMQTSGRVLNDRTRTHSLTRTQSPQNLWRRRSHQLRLNAAVCMHRIKPN